MKGNAGDIFDMRRYGGMKEPYIESGLYQVAKKLQSLEGLLGFSLLAAYGGSCSAEGVPYPCCILTTLPRMAPETFLPRWVYELLRGKGLADTQNTARLACNYLLAVLDRVAASAVSCSYKPLFLCVGASSLDECYIVLRPAFHMWTSELCQRGDRDEHTRWIASQRESFLEFVTKLERMTLHRGVGS